MRFGPVALGCLLVVMASGLAGIPAIPDTRVPTVRDVWFTTTVTPGGQRYDRTQPEAIWTKVEQFTRGKDAKVIMVVIFNDHGSHRVSGTRVNPEGKKSSFELAVTSYSGATTGWRAVTKTWEVDKLARGKHGVELMVDSKPAGTYSFVVK